MTYKFRSPEKAVPLVIMGEQFSVPWNPSNITATWYRGV